MAYCKLPPSKKHRNLFTRASYIIITIVLIPVGSGGKAIDLMSESVVAICYILVQWNPLVRIRDTIYICMTQLAIKRSVQNYP